MMILYGSQNFGYDTPESDKDWFQFLTPTVEDIVHFKQVSKEVELEDGSHVKTRDIRYIYNIIEKGNVNDMQLFFSREIIDEEPWFKWFKDNRDRLAKANLKSAFSSNMGYVCACKRDIQKGVPKGFVRAVATMNYIEQLLSPKPVTLYNESLRLLRDMKLTAEEQLKIIELQEKNLLEKKALYTSKEPDTPILKEVSKVIADVLRGAWK